MEDFLRHVRPEVAKELSIVTPESLGQDTLFHIAYARQPQMGPFISKRAGEKEDNTVPRIHAAPTIQGCILGYGGVYQIAAFDYILKKDDKQQTGKLNRLQNYRGGFYIHAIKFEAALAPSPKLVYDAKKTGETWLVTYNPETVLYQSPIVGKLIPVSVEFFPRVGSTPNSLLKVAVEITEDIEVPVDATRKIGKGYWESVYENTETTCKHKSTSPITKEQFLIYKGVSATLMSAPPTVPVWARW